jgi:Ca-activated chloride channel family protein
MNPRGGGGSRVREQKEIVMPVEPLTGRRIELVTGGEDRVALRGVRLTARLSAGSQKTIVEQTFVNLEERAIEAVYTFPLPENAAVCGFEVITADRVLTGAIEENDAAIERYENAVSEGHGAFLMEQHRPDVFSVRVGNIKPRQVATIRLTYVAPLEFVDRQVRVAFPTTVAPRYVTDTGTQDPVATAVDGEAVNPPHVDQVPYGMSVQIDVALGRAVASITSPTHSIKVEQVGEMENRVMLAGGLTEMDRDLVLSVNLKREAAPSVQVGRSKAGDAFLAVSFVPEFDADDVAAARNSETVFVLDCSGSMMGDSIAQATAALQLCLRSLSEGDTFNVCRFGSTFELMSSEPVVYGEQTLQKALRYVAEQRNLGGTELYGPLEAIFATPVGTGRVRQIILLTDGQVTNEQACIELARKNRRANRIFSFGIGAACSTSLVKGLARATAGAAEFITGGERIDDKVLRTFSRIGSPGVTDVRIDWDGADVQTLAELPPVFDGDVLTVYGRALGRAPARVTLRCRTQAGEKSWPVAVPAAADDGRLIGTMWARRAIQSIEEVNDLGRLSARQRKGHKEAQAVIALSKEFNILSSLTTFIAIEHRTVAERNEGRPETRRVPVLLAKGWGGAEEEEILMDCIAAAGGARAAAPWGMARYCMAKASPPLNKAPAPPAAGGFVGSVKRMFRRSPKVADGVQAPHSRDLERIIDHSLCRSVESKRPSDAASILALQSAEGWFAKSDLLLDARAAAVESRISLVTKQNLDRVVATVLALWLLRTRFQADEALWRRAYRKGVAYLARTLARTVEEVEAWLEEVEKAM